MYVDVVMYAANVVSVDVVDSSDGISALLFVTVSVTLVKRCLLLLLPGCTAYYGVML
jgi:hypothetical protein